MTLKLVVLYPHPTDVDQFERVYVSQHMPLMRELLGASVPLPTYRTVGTKERPAPYYRVAEIHFKNREQFDQFVQSGKSRIGFNSSKKVSTGGPPVTFLCAEQPKI